MQEIRAVKNVAIARNLMTELQGLLNQWKENSEPNTTDMKASVENHMATVHEQVEAENQPDAKLKWQFGETMTHIENYWKDLSEQLDKGYKDTISTIAILWTIEGVLAKLPTSHRDKLQARFSGLHLLILFYISLQAQVSDK